jgi:hypothetical protein
MKQYEPSKSELLALGSKYFDAIELGTITKNEAIKSFSEMLQNMGVPAEVSNKIVAKVDSLMSDAEKRYQEGASSTSEVLAASDVPSFGNSGKAFARWAELAKLFPDLTPQLKAAAEEGAGDGTINFLTKYSPIDTGAFGWAENEALAQTLVNRMFSDPRTKNAMKQMALSAKAKRIIPSIEKLKSDGDVAADFLTWALYRPTFITEMVKRESKRKLGTQ